jgi:hypothetical protein
MALKVCSVCQRHVKHADSVCPFCGASMPTGFRPALGGALVLGIGLAVAACGDYQNVANAYGPPPFAGGMAGGVAGHAGASGTATAGAPAAGNGGDGGAGGRAGAAGTSGGAGSGGA